ncbi:hypothetical protein OIU79_014787, partial [Salix purpurea]
MTLNWDDDTNGINRPGLPCISNPLVVMNQTWCVLSAVNLGWKCDFRPNEYNIDFNAELNYAITLNDGLP